MTIENFKYKVSRCVMDLSAWPPNEIELVNTVTAAELLQDIDNGVDNRASFAVATLNLDHIVKLRARADFRAAYLCHQSRGGRRKPRGVAASNFTGAG